MDKHEQASAIPSYQEIIDIFSVLKNILMLNIQWQETFVWQLTRSLLSTTDYETILLLIINLTIK